VFVSSIALAIRHCSLVLCLGRTFPAGKLVLFENFPFVFVRELGFVDVFVAYTEKDEKDHGDPDKAGKKEVFIRLRQTRLESLHDNRKVLLRQKFEIKSKPQHCHTAIQTLKIRPDIVREDNQSNLSMLLYRLYATTRKVQIKLSMSITKSIGMVVEKSFDKREFSVIMSLYILFIHQETAVNKTSAFVLDSLYSASIEARASVRFHQISSKH